MPTIIHLIYRFDIGGLEKVMADTINSLSHYQHIVICLTVATNDSKKLLNNNTRVIELHKKEGNDLGIWKRLLHLFKEIKPQVLHSYNLPTLEYQLLGFLRRIPTRIHAEHGRDANDPEGKNPKYRLLRQLINPFIHHWVAVSQDLLTWLNNTINIPAKKTYLIHNGINTNEYKALKSINKQQILEHNFHNNDFIIGTIGRIDPVKNQQILIDIYRNIQQNAPQIAPNIKFAIIGSGPLFDTLKAQITQHHLNTTFWLPGARYQINELMNSFDLFVLPSIAEGIPMTVLEAMATETTVLASNVGGLPELIHTDNGYLIAPDDINLWANKIIELYNDPDQRQKTGYNARQFVEKNFSLSAMTKQYSNLYCGK